MRAGEGGGKNALHAGRAFRAGRRLTALGLVDTVRCGYGFASLFAFLKTSAIVCCYFLRRRCLRPPLREPVWPAGRSLSHAPSGFAPKVGRRGCDRAGTGRSPRHGGRASSIWRPVAGRVHRGGRLHRCRRWACLPSQDRSRPSRPAHRSRAIQRPDRPPPRSATRQHAHPGAGPQNHPRQSPGRETFRLQAR